MSTCWHCGGAIHRPNLNATRRVGEQAGLCATCRRLRQRIVAATDPEDDRRARRELARRQMRLWGARTHESGRAR